MPIYAYICKTEQTPAEYAANGEPCNHEFTVLYQNQDAVLREEPLELCPKCGGTTKERLLVNTGTSFTLKGKGWARDGY